MGKRDRYSKTQMGLHWLTAGLIAVQFLVSVPIERDFDKAMDGDLLGAELLTILHLASGISVFALTLIRLIVRQIQGAPPAHQNVPKPIVWGSTIAHWTLLGLMLGMPVSGSIAWFGGSELASEVHEILANVLLLLIALHIIGALFEELVLGNPVLQRMTDFSHWWRG